MLRALSVSAPYAAFYGGVFLAVGILMPFWPVWLESRGLGAEEIGFVLALGTWIRVLTDPVVASFVDRSGRGKAALMLFSAISIIGFALFFFTYGFWPIALATLFTWVFFRALVPLGEAQTMAAVLAHGLDYGRIRLWGSLTFIVGALGAGRLLTGRDPDLLLWLVLGALALTFLSTLALPTQRSTETQARTGGPLAVLRHPGFLLLIGAGSLNLASHALLFGFSAIHWKAAGYSETIIGILWALGVVAEILLFMVSGRIVARLGPGNLLVIGAGAGVLRWLLMAQSTALPVLVTGQLLHAATFGAAHLAAVHFIAQSGLKATGQAVYASSNGLAMGIAMLASGALYAALDADAFYVMAVVSLIGTFAALGLRRSLLATARA